MNEVYSLKICSLFSRILADVLNEVYSLKICSDDARLLKNYMLDPYITWFNLKWRVWGIVRPWYLWELDKNHTLWWIMVWMGLNIWLQGKRWAKLQRSKGQLVLLLSKGSGQGLLIKKWELPRQNHRQQSTQNSLSLCWRRRGNVAVRV